MLTRIPGQVLATAERHRSVVLAVCFLALSLVSLPFQTASVTASQVSCAPPAPTPQGTVGTPQAPVTIPPFDVPEGAVDVSVGYLPVSIFAPVFVAYEKGYFADNGLNVTLESLSGGSDMVLLTATGELDLGVGGVGPAYWNAASQDLGVTLIAPGHQEGSPVATPLMISREACESGSIGSVAGLKGKRVAVNAPGATEYWLDTALQTEGLGLADVDLQYMSFPDAVVALDAGSLDAAMIGEPLATKAEQDGLAVRLAGDFPIQGVQPTMVFGNDGWMQEHEDATIGFVAAYLQAARDLTASFNDPLNLAIIEKYTGVSQALVAASVKPVYATDGAIDINSLATLQEFFRERGQLDYDEHIDPATLIDARYVEGAISLIGQP